MQFTRPCVVVLRANQSLQQNNPTFGCKGTCSFLSGCFLLKRDSVGVGKLGVGGFMLSRRFG